LKIPVLLAFFICENLNLEIDITKKLKIWLPKKLENKRRIEIPEILHFFFLDFIKEKEIKKNQQCKIIIFYKDLSEESIFFN